jgi:hypothetical protein
MITPMRFGLPLLVVACVWTLPACGGSEPSVTESLAKAEKEDAERKAAEQAKKDAIKVAPKDDVLEIPWTYEALQAEMPIGMTVRYALTGTDAKGKPVEDGWSATLRVNTDKEVGASATRDSAKDSPMAKQVARHEWTRASPFFWVERAETTVERREKVTVPAGEFDCVVVDFKGFFGAHQTAWMIADKPGVYAKVIEHANANEAEDQTELVYELTAIETPAD